MTSSSPPPRRCRRSLALPRCGLYSLSPSLLGRRALTVVPTCSTVLQCRPCVLHRAPLPCQSCSLPPSLPNPTVQSSTIQTYSFLSVHSHYSAFFLQARERDAFLQATVLANTNLLQAAVVLPLRHSIILHPSPVVRSSSLRHPSFVLHLAIIVSSLAPPLVIHCRNARHAANLEKSKEFARHLKSFLVGPKS
ncbi:hypothetical protein PIB30_087202, partial [Stylosanthes scabra]|nr:hypothetical protein [Stylosanthes scabra]